MLTFPVALGAVLPSLPPGPRALWREARPLFAEHQLLFAPDGRSVVVGEGSTLVLRDAETGAIRADLLRGLDVASIPGFDVVHEPRFSPDGRHVTAVVGPDQPLDGPSEFKVWSAADGAIRASIPIDRNLPYTVSVDGSTLAIAGRDGKVRVVDVAAGTVRGRFSGEAPIRLSDDGRFLVAAEVDTHGKTVSVWDTVRSRRRGMLNLGPIGRPVEIALAPDGGKLGTFLLTKPTYYDVSTGREVDAGSVAGWQAFSHFIPGIEGLVQRRFQGRPPLFLALTPGGRFAALGESVPSDSRSVTNLRWTVRVFEMPAGRELGVVPAVGVWTGALSPDGRTLALLSSRDRPPNVLKRLRHQVGLDARTGTRTAYEVEVFDVPSRLRLAWFDVPSIYLGGPGLLISPDGRTLAIDSASGSPPRGEHVVTLWDIPPRPDLARAATFAAPTTAIALPIGLVLDARSRRRRRSAASPA
ncbi:MAG TPA: WD40 repeat domain-containing protein [Isosphaeraceae bacterium]|nr:WD40 repeat domain-containing protein [Isosphaeraceae bacterium]